MSVSVCVSVCVGARVCVSVMLMVLSTLNNVITCVCVRVQNLLDTFIRDSSSVR